MAAAAVFFSFVVLSPSPMLASQPLPETRRRASLSAGVDWVFVRLRRL
jgi:multidrug efflux pump